MIIKDEFEVRLLAASILVGDIPLLKYIDSVDLQKQKISFNRECKIWHIVFTRGHIDKTRRYTPVGYSARIKTYKPNEYKYFSCLPSEWMVGVGLKKSLEMCARQIERLGGAGCLG